MTNPMEVHGWTATEYTSDEMRVRTRTPGVWVWECTKCAIHHSGSTLTPEEAMTQADNHRKEKHGRKVA